MTNYMRLIIYGVAVNKTVTYVLSNFLFIYNNHALVQMDHLNGIQEDLFFYVYEFSILSSWFAIYFGETSLVWNLFSCFL